MSARTRLLLACLATAAVVLPLGWLWTTSLHGSTYAVAAMGYADYGGGARGMSAGRTTSVRELVPDPARPADVTYDLTVRQHGDSYTVNGRSPGPELEATVGQLVEVRLHNANVAAGAALHWHGLDVPNAEDGVPGITQDAVLPGHSFTYRFVADHAGTFWYHSHQDARDQVTGGLLGALVVRPQQPETGVLDVLALSHLRGGTQTLDGLPGDRHVVVQPGQRVRVRVIDTDFGATQVWADTAYRLVAVDGRDVNAPTDVHDRAVLVPAGGRADLELTVPHGGARVQVGADNAIVLGPAGTHRAAPAVPTKNLDLLSYGSPAPLPFDPSKADRHFDYSIGRTAGFVRGKPGLQWTVDGHLWFHMPMFVVHTGDVVVMHIENNSGDVHPMHLHGHHAVVLDRDGKKATGSPWWFDSLEVENGQSYDIAFLADNPGIWMDHCHNLQHAHQGLVTHLMYAGVTTPYRVGGPHHNDPE